MSLISLNKISHYYTGKPVLSEVSLTLNKDDRIGLVGKNGSGKTTLLQIIAGKIEPTEGFVHKAKNIKIAFLSQNPLFDYNISLYEYMIQSHTELLKIKNKIDDINNLLKYESNEKNLNKLYELQQKFETEGGYELETKIKSVLTSLNFPENLWDKNINNFSGGEKTRIQLARILTKNFDYLLLDEPTNYLDIEMIFWLEKYLKNLNKPYLIVSHDRYFLNKMINSIVLIEEGKLFRFKGNYDNFEREFEQRNKLLQKEAAKQEKFIKKTEEFIAKNIAGQKTKQAKSRIKQLEKIKKIEPRKNPKNLKLTISSEKRSGNDVFIIKNLSFAYTDKKLLDNVSLSINYQDKIVILGKNGSGKSTFLKLLNSELTPLSGFIKRGSSLQIAYFDQLHINLNNSLTVFETIKQICPTATNGFVLSYLAKFGFRGEETEKPVGVLSGGEKARLYLSKIILNKPNVLIMDEPTNHLDIPTIKSLENALQSYQGTLIFVSHDIEFIKNLANRILYLKNGKLIEKYNTLENILKEDFFNSAHKKRSSKTKPTKKRKINPILIEKKLNEIEKITAEYENEKAKLKKLQNKFGDNNFMKNAQNVIKLQEEIKILENRIENFAKKIDNLETEYLLMIEGEN